MFNEFDFKLTLFTVTNPSWAWPANWTGLQNASSQGHEIASHTVTHTSFSGMADSIQLNELKNSQDVINDHITGQKCVTIAYPYCVTGNNSLVGQYYFAARGCSGSTESKTPSNFMNISSIICGSEGSIKTNANFKSRVDNAANTKGWVVYLIHGINGSESGAYSPISEDTIRASLEYLKANQDNFWVSTFGNVASYIKERNSVSVEELSFEDTTITLSVTDTLDNSIFNYPVTIRRLLPENWISVSVSQNGNLVNAQVVEVNSVKYVMFDVVPDGGEVLFTKSNVTDISDKYKSELLAPHLMQNYPNPFNPTTVIKFSLPEKSYIRLIVLNTLGQTIKEIAKGNYSAGIHSITLNAVDLTSGIYFYKLEADKFVDVKKFIVMK